MSLLWTERTSGRAAALTALQDAARSLALIEPESPPDSLCPATAPRPATRSQPRNQPALQALTSSPPLATPSTAPRPPPSGGCCAESSVTRCSSRPSRPIVPTSGSTTIPLACNIPWNKSPTKDLNWFFNDWVYRDRGLPDLSIANVTPSQLDPRNGLPPAGWSPSRSVTMDTLLQKCRSPCARTQLLRPRDCASPAAPAHPPASSSPARRSRSRSTTVVFLRPRPASTPGNSSSRSVKPVTNWFLPRRWDALASNGECTEFQTLPIIKMDQETKPLPRSGIHLHLLCPASQEPEARGERQKILAGPSHSSASFLSLTGAVANSLLTRGRRRLWSRCRNWRNILRWRLHRGSRRHRWGNRGHLTRFLLRLQCFVVGILRLRIRIQQRCIRLGRFHARPRRCLIPLLLLTLVLDLALAHRTGRLRQRSRR